MRLEFAPRDTKDVGGYPRTRLRYSIKVKARKVRKEDKKIFSKINNIISSKRLDTSPLKKKKGEPK